MKKKAPRVGIIIRALSIGGAEKQSLMLAKVLTGSYPTILFVQKETPKEDRHINFIEKEGIRVVFLKGSFLGRLLQIIRIIKKDNLNIVFSYLTLDNLLAACAGVFTKITTIGGIRNCLLPKSKFIVNLFLHRLLLDFMLFNNYDGRDSFLKMGYSKKKTFVIHNCIESNSEMKSPKDNKEAINIISVGRFTESKDYLTAIKAIKRLSENIGNKFKLKYYIIGYGELEKSIRAWIKDYLLDFAEVVIKPNNLAEYYKNADIILSSSIFEGLPNVLMEALSYSIPIVATDVGDNKYIVKDSMNGYNIAPKDYLTMANKLQFLVENKEERLRFGENGLQILDENFSIVSFKNKYNEVIDKCLL